jgi:hypothetical protein
MYAYRMKSQQNWLKLGEGKIALRSITLLILFGIRRNCLRSWNSRSHYLLITKVIKQIVVITESYQFC